MPNPGDPATAETIPYGVWVADRESRFFQPGIWIVIEGGAASSIEEQYTP